MRHSAPIVMPFPLMPLLAEIKNLVRRFERNCFAHNSSLEGAIIIRELRFARIKARN